MRTDPLSEYTHDESVDRRCADCGAAWQRSADGLSAHMVHEPTCEWVAWLLEQDELQGGRGLAEFHGGAEEWDRWHPALVLHTEYLGEWCPKHERTVLVVGGGSNPGFAGEGVAWTDLACGHTNVEVGEVTMDLF